MKKTKMIDKYKKEWLEKQGCKFIIEPQTESVIIVTKDNEYIDLTNLGNEANNVNFIYKHRLTNLMSVHKAEGKPLNFDGSCEAVSIGFNEKEQAWYGWTHRGYGKFGIGYEVKEGSIMNYGDHKYPYVAKTLDDCLNLAIHIAKFLN